jgi:hypothetical protein
VIDIKTTGLKNGGAKPNYTHETSVSMNKHIKKGKYDVKVVLEYYEEAPVAVGGMFINETVEHGQKYYGNFNFKAEKIIGATIWADGKKIDRYVFIADKEALGSVSEAKFGDIMLELTEKIIKAFN